MRILLTGGTGFIGSHTCVALLEAGHHAIIVDNLSNSKKSVVARIEEIAGKSVEFIEADITDKGAVQSIIRKHKPEGLIHFAALKAVAESIEKPVDYYHNNVSGAIILADLCIENQINKFVYSSSATVYEGHEPPFHEEMGIGSSNNPYGQTKIICERILTDVAKANPEFSVSLLRYFNPVGGHPSGLIGEDPNGIPNNLLPLICKVAKGDKDYLSVFGNDYPTPDGSCIRDYVHVMDLARGHVLALEKLGSGVNTYNIGTGQGASVLDLIRTFERVNGIKVPYKIEDRRPGDSPVSYASIFKSKDKLGYSPEYGLDSMVRDAWKYIKNSRQD